MARFTLPRDVYHGKGCLSELKNLKGKKAVLVVGGGSMKRQGFLDKAVNYLKEGGMEVKLIEGVEPDPSVETVMKGAKVMQEFEPDWIVAMGGGSPIDAAKAMWVFYEYPDETFENIITPFSFPELRQKAKFAAIPSTSGTATEVTAFSVITDYNTGIKYPLADFNITPDVAIVDPELVEGLPQKQVAYTGMDALTHAIEAYVAKSHFPFTDGLALEAIGLVGKSLQKACENGRDMDARTDMCWAEYMAGLAFSNAGLGMVHAMAHQLGGFYNTPHGVANAILLTHVMKYNLPSCKDRYADIARALKIDTSHMTPDQAANAAIDYIEKLAERIHIPKLSQTAFKPSDVLTLSLHALEDTGMPENPREATLVDVQKVFMDAYYAK